MTMRNIFNRFFVGRAHVAGMIYGAAVLGLIIVGTWSIVDLFDQYSTYSERADVLARLQQRARSLANSAGAEAWPPGSPFLEGQTETVASAALLQRITSAVTEAGGSLVSSEVDRSGARDKEGYQRVTATCDIDEVGLQRLLYDLEANMPLLVIESLMVQSRASQSGSQGGRLQAQVRVAGRWGGAN
jgi:general secretion pathway protein M